jgi:hypothetical protein
MFSLEGAGGFSCSSNALHRGLRINMLLDQNNYIFSTVNFVEVLVIKSMDP